MHTLKRTFKAHAALLVIGLALALGASHAQEVNLGL